jgi:hypothetical protein
MKHSWLEPSRKKANIAVGLYYYPGGFGGSRLVRPATVELENGQLVDVPLTLIESDRDLEELLAGLVVYYDKREGSHSVGVPPKKGRRPRAKKKKKRS